MNSLSTPANGLSRGPARPRARTVVAIATAGRREQMSVNLARLAVLRPAPLLVLVCPATPSDLDLDAVARIASESGMPVLMIPPPAKGAAVQRNAMIEWLLRHDSVNDKAWVEHGSPTSPETGFEHLLFIDDDFLPALDYLERLDELFDRHPTTVALTGRPLLDGATGPGIDPAEADEALRRFEQSADRPFATVSDTYGVYGCNMAFRWRTLRLAGAKFEESFPLYSWLEDIDFSRQVAPYGRVADSPALKGVHLGTKSGRVSGVRFGYSQLANPLHCVRKGTMTRSYAMRQIARNVAANLLKLARPEPWVDRKGRLRGNAMAFADLVRGRMRPQRIVEL